MSIATHQVTLHTSPTHFLLLSVIAILPPLWYPWQLRKVNKMESKKEILDETVERLISRALAKLEQSNEAVKSASAALAAASDALVENTRESPETRCRLDEYAGRLAELSAIQYSKLYQQGARDCVALLKTLGVIR